MAQVLKDFGLKAFTEPIGELLRKHLISSQWYSNALTANAWRCKLDLQHEQCACKLNLQDQLKKLSMTEEYKGKMALQIGFAT
ncbi:MAG: hypothetical protein IPN89_14760 [Saprospiraceae bacterium]|nr:hypothetical protein [Saprospiraceae bacterium]